MARFTESTSQRISGASPNGRALASMLRRICTMYAPPDLPSPPLDWNCKSVPIHGNRRRMAGCERAFLGRAIRIAADDVGPVDACPAVHLGWFGEGEELGQGLNAAATLICRRGVGELAPLDRVEHCKHGLEGATSTFGQWQHLRRERR